MRRKWMLLFVISTILITQSCKEVFNPNLDPTASNYLVVEGIINAAGVTTINLSRTVPLKDSSSVKTEASAQVSVEGEGNIVYPLREKQAGTYLSDSVILNPNIKYRLHIHTKGGGEYLSAFVAVKKTPAIDSVSWKATNGNVQIYASSHDPSNNTRYYKWDYQETWEIHSAFDANYIYSNGQVTDRPFSDLPSLYYCWQTAVSKTIITGSSTQLANDVISLQPIAYIPRASIKTSVRYSILVKQYAVDKQAYDFYELMKKNTESLGSIFDAQPSEIVGNITCVSNPKEKVIGFITASTVEQKRIFISKDDLGGSAYTQGCETVLVANNKDSFKMYFDHGGLLPYAPHLTGITIDHYYSSTPLCIDCRFRGTNIKPTFW